MVFIYLGITIDTKVLMVSAEEEFHKSTYEYSSL